MNLAILGATGRTGVEVVRAALARGHTVTVLARDPRKASDLLPAEAGVVEGDLTDAASISAVVAGADAVLDVSGPVKGSPSDLRRCASRHLVAAMQEHGVKRLVLLTGAGVRVDGDRPKIADRAIRGLMSRLQPEILEDGQAAVATVQAAPLDWTVVRAPRLRDAGRRGEVRVAAHVGGDTGVTLGRADLAEFLLDEVEGGKWSGRSPVVSW